jgi:uncharacterized integral membrane protein
MLNGYGVLFWFTLHLSIFHNHSLSRSHTHTHTSTHTHINTNTHHTFTLHILLNTHNISFDWLPKRIVLPLRLVMGWCWMVMGYYFGSQHLSIFHNHSLPLSLAHTHINAYTHQHKHTLNILLNTHNISFDWLPKRFELPLRLVMGWCWMVMGYYFGSRYISLSFTITLTLSLSRSHTHTHTSTHSHSTYYSTHITFHLTDCPKTNRIAPAISDGLMLNGYGVLFWSTLHLSIFHNHSHSLSLSLTHTHTSTHTWTHIHTHSHSTYYSTHVTFHLTDYQNESYCPCD